MSDWLFQAKFLNKSIFEWILILNIGVCSLIIGLFRLIGFLSWSLPSSRTEIISFIKSFLLIIFLVAQSLFIFSLEWSRFQDYVDTRDSLIRHQDSIRTNQTKRRRRKNFLLQIIATLIFQTLIMITQGIIFKSFRVFIYLFIHLGEFCLTAILVDTSVNLTGQFKNINSSLKSIGSSELQLQHRLVEIRKLYLQTVQATISAETFFQFVVTFHYVVNFVSFIFLTLDFKSSSIEHRVLWIQLIIFGMIRLIYLTLKMSSVHVNSKRAFEHLYHLSLNTNRISVLEEIHNFMMRVSSTNIGFTFAGLLLISPNFIASLLSFSFTIGIALIGKLD